MQKCVLVFFYVRKEVNTMKNTITQQQVLTKTAVFDKQEVNRYELTIATESKKEKSILVIGLNPASDNIQISDTTTNYIINNLVPMGYTKITLCNLFSCVCNKLKSTDMIDNQSNREYLQEVLQRDFNAILVGYGNTYINNKRVKEEKMYIDSVLKACNSKVFEIVDKQENYSRLKTIHPLFAGQRFSGEWKLRKYIIEENEKSEEEDNDNKALDNETTENNG